MAPLTREMVQNGVIGHAIGDALGVPVEFYDREELRQNPVTGMRNGGTYGTLAGTWSDDTSMEIATMQAIINCEKIDYNAIMSNFLNWCRNGEFSATGRCFDIGGTCLTALSRYEEFESIQKCGLTSVKANGNGSLMRILPVAFICHKYGLTGHKEYELVKNISSLTHAHPISVMGCFIYVQFVCYLLAGFSIEEAYLIIREYDYSAEFEDETRAKYTRILDSDISQLSEEEIKSTGYVVDSLEAALWCLLTTKNYKDAVLKAVNLGTDTDTIAAITGSMAGIVYGLDSVPDEWIMQLKRRKYLMDLCGRFAETEIKL